MRICVVIPDEAFLKSAGTRIRYKRLQAEIEKHGMSLEMRLLQDFRSRDQFVHDVYLISKVYDARSVLMASQLSSLGRIVGVDLFDDYFSQGEDSRFIHLRDWLRRLGGYLDFALCSTPRMQRIASDYLPGRPVHVLNDPFDQLNGAEITARYAKVMERALSTRRVEIGWFGAGDSTFFPVGLNDVLACSDMAMRLRGLGYEPSLSVLTGARSLGVAGLEMLQRLPMPYRLEEWSEAGERDLIAQSLVCFLPVNAQRFSIGKSMNRAITAITGGSQVLSAGFPLYERLGEFVYRDIAVLMRDVEAGRPAIRAETLPRLTETLGEIADPSVEATRFAAFLSGLPSKAGRENTRPQLLLHGRRSTGAIHKFARALGAFAVGTPLSAGKLNYDISFALPTAGDGFEIRLTAAAAERITPAWRERCEALPKPEGRHSLRIRDVGSSRYLRLGTDMVPAGAAFYEGQVREFIAVLKDLLPAAEIILSETDPCFRAELKGATA